MRPEEFIKLMWKEAHDQRSKDQKETDETINKISQKLYMGLREGALRRLAVRSLKEILKTLPENPTEEDINITVKFIEAIILTIISCILKGGKILTITPIKDKDKKQPGDKNAI